MKIQPKFVCCPISLWSSTELTWSEKIALLTIDSATSEPSGVKMSVNTLATAMNIPQAESKKLLNTLYKKGALEVSIDEDGNQMVAALLFKDSYNSDDNKREIVGDKPTRNQYDYEAISQQWQQINPELPQLTRWTPKRKKALRNCLSEVGLTVDSLYKAFKIVAATPFLNGSSNQFKTSPDWLLKANNLQKVIEGYYCRSYQEKNDYQTIMTGGDINANSHTSEDVYK